LFSLLFFVKTFVSKVCVPLGAKGTVVLSVKNKGTIDFVVGYFRGRISSVVYGRRKIDDFDLLLK